MILKWMFPGGKSLPHVIVSHNARFDPHFHIRMGAALRPLRYQKILLIGSGGAVHNLYRNAWDNAVLKRDSLAQNKPPEQWAIDFGEAFSNVVTQNSGPALRRGMARLMSHPQYRDAQGTDDHFMSALFIAGAAGDLKDKGTRNYAGAECWELLNMRNVSGAASSLTFSLSSSLATGRWSRASRQCTRVCETLRSLSRMPNAIHVHSEEGVIVDKTVKHETHIVSLAKCRRRAHVTRRRTHTLLVLLSGA